MVLMLMIFLAAILIGLVNYSRHWGFQNFFKKDIYCTVCECISSLVKLTFLCKHSSITYPYITVTQQTPPKGLKNVNRKCTIPIWHFISLNLTTRTLLIIAGILCNVQIWFVIKSGDSYLMQGQILWFRN